MTSSSCVSSGDLYANHTTRTGEKFRLFTFFSTRVPKSRWRKFSPEKTILQYKFTTSLSSVVQFPISQLLERDPIHLPNASVLGPNSQVVYLLSQSLFSQVISRVCVRIFRFFLRF